MSISLRLVLVFLIIVLVSIFIAPSHVAPAILNGCPAKTDSGHEVSFGFMQLIVHKGGGENV
jgi:hypothetical protein